MAKFFALTQEKEVLEDIEKIVVEALDIGMSPENINKIVQETLAWAMLELSKEEFEA